MYMSKESFENLLFRLGLVLVVVFVVLSNVHDMGLW